MIRLFVAVIILVQDDEPGSSDVKKSRRHVEVESTNNEEVESTPVVNEKSKTLIKDVKGARRKKRRHKKNNQSGVGGEGHEGEEDDEIDEDGEGGSSSTRRGVEGRPHHRRATSSLFNSHSRHDQLNFNRDYEASSHLSPASSSSSHPHHNPSPLGGPSEPEVGVLDDETLNEQLRGPGRQRNKGAKGIGEPVSPGIGVELEELDADELQEFAYKPTQALSATGTDNFEYHLAELHYRLGTSMKILTAGYDEAIMNVPHIRPTNTYISYNLGPSHGDLYNMAVEETHNYGHEYRPKALPSTPMVELLNEAASERRMRKMDAELESKLKLKQQRAEDREAQRERSVNSRSASAHTSRKHSRRGSSITGLPQHPPLKRTLALKPGARSSLPGMNTRSSVGGNTNMRRSMVGPNLPSGYASPRG